MNPTARDRELDLLYEITQLLLSAELDLAERLRGVLRVLGRRGMPRGMITLLDEDRRHTQVEVSESLSLIQERRGRYRPGEGIVGQVIERGKPAIVPRVGDEPLFLDRTGARADLDLSNIAFICVPLRGGDEVVGTLSVDCPDFDASGHEEALRVLTIISAIIAKSVEAYREHCAELQSLRAENTRLEGLREVPHPAFMIGSSHQIRETFNLIHQVASHDTTVLIRGESGTGKELVARAIHQSSRRADKPFVSVNCAALPEQLVASELFGHVRGAFTGADVARKGRFELADGGTIFLDEIGEIAPAIQVKLLRVLQEGEIDRLGDERTRRVNVRVLAATNANLEDSIERGVFRSDLYYRLNVFPIYVPALRERRSDITALADFFLERHAKESGLPVLRISTPAIELLTSYHWPGNVRELENCMQRAMVLAEDGVIRSRNLPPTLQTGRSSGTTKGGSLESLMMAYEREILLEAIKNAGGNQAKAARALDTTPRIFSYRLRKHGLHEGYARER